MKKCTKCKEPKEFTEFHKSKLHKDGLSHWCKFCVSEYNKNHRRVNNNEKVKNYYKNPKFRDRKKEYRKLRDKDPRIQLLISIKTRSKS